MSSRSGLLFLAHGAPLVSVPAIDGAFDLEQRMEVSDRSSAIGETVCSAPSVDRADRDGSGERLLGHAQALQETRKIGGFADALDRLCERACAALSLGHLQVSQVQARLSSGSMVLVLSQTVIRLTMADGFSRLGPHSRACRL